VRVVYDLHHGVLAEALAMLFVDRAILGPADLVAWADGTYQKDEGTGRWPFHTDFPPRAVEVASTNWLKEHGADIIIATTSINRPSMSALAHDLGALLVNHFGNQGEKPFGEVALRSIEGEGGLLYHPEFHRVPWVPPSGKRVGAFHASFPTLSDCFRLWQERATEDWQVYGVPGNPLSPYEVAQARSDCAAIWHCKDADGYGFGVHEAFASGRPVVGHAAHYEDKLAEPLFVRGVTYVEPTDDVRGVIENPVTMGMAAIARFEGLVDFDGEAEAIASYLGNALW